MHERKKRRGVRNKTKKGGARSEWRKSLDRQGGGVDGGESDNKRREGR